MENSNQETEIQQKATATAGLVYFGAISTGFLGIVAAIMAMSDEISSGGMYLLASAFAFGLLANALYRN
ncbi:hypothetical protein [Gimesia panareensis]|uniref:Uncharacterized protein n=1 Tax=Gimesia panareensis TaxID=2527978 RepID=A0A518ACV7_9PLAN|nr:hypothetical protein [Gimesia panareensis]QDT29489.1 hypothetical protein Enr10x_48440 [Gimesia panareensis]QDU52534.1 hypothetical protein Pan110_49140 [Gimesia panareensis]